MANPIDDIARRRLNDEIIRTGEYTALRPYQRPGKDLVDAKSNVAQYSVARVLLGEDGVERDISKELAKQTKGASILPIKGAVFGGPVLGQLPRPMEGTLTPARAVFGPVVQVRDLSVSTDSAIIQQLTKLYFPYLWVSTPVLQAGARLITDLPRGQYKFPQGNSSTPVQWSGENAALTDQTNVTFNQISASYFRVSTYSVFSRELVHMAGTDRSVEDIIRQDLSNSIGVANRSCRPSRCRIGIESTIRHFQYGVRQRTPVH